MTIETTKSDTVSSQEIWVLVDDPTGTGDLAKYSGPQKLPVEMLGEHLQSFVSGISKALQRCKTSVMEVGEFELTEVTLDAKLTTEVGFVLVSKTGIEGTISLKFEKQKVAERTST
jgi:hypothetical protein